MENVHTLISGTREYVKLQGKRGFVDLIKVMDFKTDYPGWPNLITEALTSKDEEQIQLKSERCEV